MERNEWKRRVESILVLSKRRKRKRSYLRIALERVGGKIKRERWWRDVMPLAG